MRFELASTVALFASLPSNHSLAIQYYFRKERWPGTSSLVLGVFRCTCGQIRRWWIYSLIAFPGRKLQKSVSDSPLRRNWRFGSARLGNDGGSLGNRLR